MRSRCIILCLCAVLLLISAGPAGAQEKGSALVLQAMRDELSRSLEKLRTQPTPPYFLSYEITETQSVSVSGAFGTVTGSGENRRRLLDIDLRVGDYTLDNTHTIRGGPPSFDFSDRFIEVPIENDPAAIRSALWYYTDRKYKRAVEQLTKVKTNVQVKVEQEDRSADFSPEAPEKSAGKPIPISADRRIWEDRIRRYTAPFARYGDIYEASATFSVTGETRWYVSSDGTEIQTSQPVYRLFISAFTKADDGMVLPRYESFFAVTPDGLPNDEAALKAVDRMIQDLQALRTAPVIDPYTGPAILSGRASGVFFHEVFGHRIEGHRQKREEESQTFKKKVNQQVLPDAFSVYFDPTVQRLGRADLMGHYLYDNQGVRARRVPVIENGIFKGFLMSRSPIEGFPTSNGHGRKQPGYAPVSRQSNLIVQVSQPVSRADLKRMLLDQVKQEGKPFGLLFEDIQGGFTITGRTIPNAFNVLPIMVYRIYPDGREELVRGVDLIGTPLTAFSKIAAADDQVGIFNGICGAESGGVPVSAASPGVLITQIEVQKKEKSQERPPILPPPFEDGGAQPAPRATEDVVMRAMRDELARSMEKLQLEKLEKPYFIAYRAQEITSAGVSASFGGLVSSNEGRSRHLAVEVRIGDYALDNTNFSGSRGFGGTAQLPLEDDDKEIRRQIWLATDGAYKRALEDLSRKRAALQNRTRGEEVPDFSKEEAVTIADEAPPVKINRTEAEALVRGLSALFRDMPDVFTSAAQWNAGTVYTRYINSEGSSFTRTTPSVSLRVLAGTQAVDGLPLEDFIALYGCSTDDLPRKDEIAARVREMGARLAKLREAPYVEQYNGPVLFEGQAAAEVFSQVFAPKLVALRRPVSDNPQFERAASQIENPFMDRLEARVLPDFMSVVDNPTATDHEGRRIGGYKVDDDGVRAREMRLIEKGVLKTLLATRTPVRGVPQSTGSRWGAGAMPSNLFVTAENGLGDEELRAAFLRQIAQRGKEYGIVVRRIGNPFLTVSRDRIPAIFGPPGGDATRMEGVILACRVFPDGREELIRGGELTGIGPATFKEISAASRSRTLYSSPFAIRGFGGVSGGSVVSFVVPSLLFEDVSLKRPAGEIPKLPVARHPFFEK